MASITEKLSKFKDNLAIDKSALDKELQEHPTLYYEVSELYAEACARRDFLKEQVSLTDAELSSKHTRLLEKEFGKATVSAIAAAVNADPKHQKAFERHIKAKEVADNAGALKDAFHQRSYMLRELCGLFISNYFQSGTVTAASNTTSDIKAERNKELMREARERGGATVKNSMRRKRE